VLRPHDNSAVDREQESFGDTMLAAASELGDSVGTGFWVGSRIGESTGKPATTSRTPCSGAPDKTQESAGDSMLAAKKESEEADVAASSIDQERGNTTAAIPRKNSQNVEAAGRAANEGVTKVSAHLPDYLQLQPGPEQLTISPAAWFSDGRSDGPMDAKASEANAKVNSQSVSVGCDIAKDQPALASTTARSEAGCSGTTGDGTANSVADVQVATDAQAPDSSSSPQATATQAASSRHDEATTNADSAGRAAVESATRAVLEKLASGRTAAEQSSTLGQPTTDGSKLQPPSGAQNSHSTGVSGSTGTAGPSINGNATIAGSALVPRTVLPAVGGAATSNMNGDTGTSDSPGTATGAKQHADTSPSNAPDNGTSAGQGQVSPNPQPASIAAAAQNTPVSVVNAPLHVVQDGGGHPASGANSFASNLPGSSGTSTRTPQAQESGPSGTEPQPAVAAINAARLIQRVGDSEIRVGMHSADFGNVSISTITSRGAITAQISLDHGELAKTIAAHLPETQARLGANQSVEVRISTNQQGVGGEQGGTRQDATGKGSGGNRQPGQDYSGESMIRAPETTMAGLAAAPPESNAISSRLDIRV
jgi:hypothetical protein